MSSRWSWLASGAAVVCGLSALGCARTHLQREVAAAGTPTHLEGNPLVLLPRTCIAGKRLTSRNIPPTGLGARTTLRLRTMLDAMVEGGAQRVGTDAVDTCKPAPDLSIDPAQLSELKASEHTLQMMRERGAELAVVIEIQTTIACSTGSNGVLLTHYGGAGLAASTAFTGSDSCDDDQIELSAYVFRADGSALWVGTREIVPGDPVQPAVERLLRRIPVTLPLQLQARASATDTRCRVDERGAADCA